MLHKDKDFLCKCLIFFYSYIPYSYNYVFFNHFTDNKRTDSVESLDCLRPEGTWHGIEILDKVGLHEIGDEGFTREAIQS